MIHETPKPANDEIIREFADYKLKPRYECRKDGVYYIGVKTDREGNIGEADPLLLADRIEIIGTGQDEDGAYCRIIRWQDKLTHRRKTAALPMGEIGTAQGWARLKEYGITVLSGRAKQERLADYLQTEGGHTPFTITNKAGWHGNTYILPGGEVITAEGTAPTVVYNGSQSHRQAYQAGGTLEQWQAEIARYAAGNSRLILAIGTALAAPFLPLLHLDGGGFHLYDNSTSGKTTSSNIAQSVWCIGGKKGRLSWDCTTNAMEKRALARNNNLVVPDEIGEAKNINDVARACYKLANGNIRGRLDRYGQDTPQQDYDVLVFSTGEHSLSDFVHDGGGKWNVGQDVRIVSIKAKAGVHGAFDTIHHYPSGKAFADHLNSAAMRYYGTAGRALISLITQGRDAAVQSMTAYQLEFMQSLGRPMGNQAQRVAQRFALVAAALAFAQPITLIAKEDAFSAIARCFDDWLTGAGAEDYERRKAIGQAVSWFDQNGTSQRFCYVGNSKARPIDYIQPPNFAGYRQHKEGSTNAEGDLFMMTRTAFQEMTQGLGERRAAEIYTEIGWLRPPASDGRPTHKALDTGTRCYFFNGMYPPCEQ